MFWGRKNLLTHSALFIILLLRTIGWSCIQSCESDRLKYLPKLSRQSWSDGTRTQPIFQLFCLLLPERHFWCGKHIKYSTEALTEATKAQERIKTKPTDNEKQPYTNKKSTNSALSTVMALGHEGQMIEVGKCWRLSCRCHIHGSIENRCCGRGTRPGRGKGLWVP